MASQVEQLVAGMAATITCLELWGLSTDDSKTYVWATDAAGRQRLRAWDYAVQYDARELGGSLFAGQLEIGTSSKEGFH